MVYVLYVTSSCAIDRILFERMLQTAASASAIDELCRKHGYKVRQGIYSLPVVIWLMMYQRLHGKRTLSTSVQFLARQADQWQQQPNACKRVRQRRISTQTGGYCQARSKMPTLRASSVCDHVFEQLQMLMRQQLPDVPRPLFVIDGSTFQLAHKRELVKAFSARVQPPRRQSLADDVAGDVS